MDAEASLRCRHWHVLYASHMLRVLVWVCKSHNSVCILAPPPPPVPTPAMFSLQTQSFDQVFENMNKALKLSCLKGLPVRVVRSYKEKRSSYAPPEEQPVRYDGIYRILRCWRKKGQQGFLMCRYMRVQYSLGSQWV